MSKSLIAVFSFILAAQVASAQVTGLGPCPKVEVVKNFNVKRYLGLWYEISKYPNFFSQGAKCITANYGLNKNGTVSVLNKQVKNGTKESISGVARVISSGILGVSFPSVPFNVEAEYKVLDTDYRMYAVVFSCSSSPPRVIDGRYVWILSRYRKASPKTLKAIKAALVKHNISQEFLQVTDQTGCF